MKGFPKINQTKTKKNSSLKAKGANPCEEDNFSKLNDGNADDDDKINCNNGENFFNDLNDEGNSPINNHNLGRLEVNNDYI